MNEILDEQKLSSKLVRHHHYGDNNSVLYKIGIFYNNKNMSSMKKTYEKNKTKLNIDRMTQVSLKNDIKRLDNIHQIFKNKIHKRYRRQLKFIPLSNDNNNNNNLPISIYPIFNLNDNNLSKKFDPILIRKILNVFNDKPVFHNNYHSIKPGEFIIAPTKYIDSVKLIPGVYDFNKNNYNHDDDVSYKNIKIQDIGENNNFTTGFGESQRTTGFEEKNEKNSFGLFENSSVENKEFNQSNLVINNKDIKLINPLNITNNLSYIENENNELNRTDKKEVRLKIQQKHNNGNNNQNNKTVKYTFEYNVNDDKSKNFFGHRESRNDDITIGNYNVRLPDRVQHVNYRVDENGYQASVTYTMDNLNTPKINP
ncbi:hypothetical protein HCN44_008261 [Aphidius gifuensis]|uniref:Uncharacterized protein n=2 Tax=Aphidius gifuensis TaxID=684658 RepID=A0A834XQ40_APHGI|nr:hypothetical protein HCN44_008261 [Aphidius gifuensis]